LRDVEEEVLLTRLELENTFGKMVGRAAVMRMMMVSSQAAALKELGAF
jgi:hypothetical protein